MEGARRGRVKEESGRPTEPKRLQRIASATYEMKRVMTRGGRGREDDKPRAKKELGHGLVMASLNSHGSNEREARSGKKYKRRGAPGNPQPKRN